MALRGGDCTPRSSRHDKTIEDLFFAGLVEGDGELVAVDAGDLAIAELVVKDSATDRERRLRAGALGDQFTFDGGRPARRTASYVAPCGGFRLGTGTSAGGNPDEKARIRG